MKSMKKSVINTKALEFNQISNKFVNLRHAVQSWDYLICL